MPGKQTRVLCPVCQEPIPPDETECENCGAFVIDEAVVRLSRALGLDHEKALKLFEAGFRHPKQLRDRDPNRVLEKGEVGILFICTNCGGFVASGDAKCPRCAAEFDTEPEEPAPEEKDILDVVLCSVCGADNNSDLAECEICRETLKEPKEPAPAAPKMHVTVPAAETTRIERALENVDDSLPGSDVPVPGVPKPAPAPPATSRTAPSRPVSPLKTKPTVPAPPRPRAAPSRAKPGPTRAPGRPRATAKGRPPAPPLPTSRPLPHPGPAVEIQAKPAPIPFREAPPTPAMPMKRVRPAASEIPRKRVRSAAQARNRISAEISGSLVLAAAASFLLAGVFDQLLVSTWIAVFLIGFCAYTGAEHLRSRSGRSSPLDGLLLGAGHSVG